MRAYNQGAFIRVTVSRAECEQFAQRWPGFGVPRAYSFTFDASNGDLVDMYHNGCSNDDAGVLALSHDAGTYAMRRFKLQDRWMREQYIDDDDETEGSN